MKKEQVIVFGGSGFLGSYVADALTEAGFAVRIFDQKPSKYLRTDQEMIEGNITDLAAVKMAAKGCQYVYNFAGIADIADASERPLDVTTVNVLGNVHALEAAVECNAKRFVFASTVYVFSDHGSFYRVSKQSAERYVEAYAEKYKLDYTILRYGSLYGRRASTWNGIHKLLRQALQEKKIVYQGSSHAMREYIHVQDAARLSVEILSPEYVNRHMIITGHERLAVKALIRMIAEMVPGEVEMEFTDTQAEGHYVMGPYTFNPKLGHKIISNDHIDIGQGLLDCMAEIYEELHHTKMIDGELIIQPNDASTPKKTDKLSNVP